jgi:hypothetical protein
MSASLFDRSSGLFSICKEKSEIDLSPCRTRSLGNPA